ncbi:MAG: Do family serine endopeptidase [Brevundimonas sp.]|uniref:Do family serine endopeptidase n=1 Tax=Brevundimonas sp. TaxID=1871086 RepID=UPI002584C00C|nr:Do family serine endopeptidase [Brevundimonas sp.]MCV0415403.1 Do family serine endopeptidase [Brevundimonas sp.]
MLKRKEFILGAAAGLTLAAAATAGGVITWPGAHAEPQAVNRITPVPANGDSFSPPPGAPNSFATIFEQVAPAVVQIDVTVPVEQPQGLFQIPGLPFQFVPPNGRGGQGQDAEPQTTQGAGSGFFISQDGYIVTNNHVVADATEIKVKMSDGRELPARLIGRDQGTDLAVIKVEGDDFKYVSFEETAQPRVGDWVIAVGNPFGLGGTATAGIVSAKARDIDPSGYNDYIQIDAAINRGNSGGPTFDIYGRVIGVNSAIYSPTGGSVGIGFAIPAETAKSITARLMRGETIERGYLGVQITNLADEYRESLGLPATQKGAYVAEVTPDAPAARGGLRPGDVVVSLNGKAVEGSTELTRAVGAAKPGDNLRLEVLREGRRQTIDIRAGTRPADLEIAANDDSGSGAPANPGAAAGEVVEGMTVAPLNGALRRRFDIPETVDGLVVTAVSPQSRAGRMQFQPGFVIMQANGRSLGSAADLKGAVETVKSAGRPGVLLLVRTPQGNRPVVLPLEGKN